MQIQINQERLELKSHGDFSFPVYISHEVLADYEMGQFAWHWHPEIEVTLFIQGEMEYQINDKVYHVKAGQVLFCNTNALHSGHMVGETDCQYIAITFLPRMVYGFEGSLLQTDYVEPLLSDSEFAGLLLDKANPEEAPMVEAAERIYEVSRNGSETKEMEIVCLLQQFWLHLYRIKKPSIEAEEVIARRNMERIKKLLEYMHAHYEEPVTLEDIAASVNICKSECCRFFKKYMKKTLFEYLTEYRISQSLVLLSKEEYTVTEVADRCGFSNPCYFAKVFKTQMHMTPREYRRKNKREDIQDEA